MIYRYNWHVALAATCVTLYTHATISPDTLLSHVHVPYEAHHIVTCASESSFVVCDAQNPKHSRTLFAPIVRITTHNGLLSVNDKVTKSRAILLSSATGIVYNGMHYDEPLLVEWDGTTITLKVRTKAKPVLVPMNIITDTASKEAILVSPKVVRAPQEAVSIPQKTAAHKEHAHTVRVLLAQQAVGAEQTWCLSSAQGFYVQVMGDAKRYQLSGQLRVRATKKIITINDLHFPADQQLLIIPCKGTTEFEDNTYQGALTVLVHNNQFYLINALALEDYVVCVLNTESWPGWPLEVNKVFAITCRTYVIAMIMNHTLSKQPYHIKNTNAHQTYAGTHSREVLKEAVEQTKGVFVAYNKKPITAMFDACCGGIIPADVAGMNFNHAPYLSRTYACSYCKPYKIYEWNKRYTTTQIINAFSGIAPRIKKMKIIKEFKVTKRDKAGLVQEVSIKGTGNAVIRIKGKQVYGSLKGVTSRCFDIQKDGAHFSLHGYGYGHQMGLCQWGAYGMVQAGYQHKEILNFYYPGTHLMHLK